MAKIITANALLSKQVTRRDRVLLLNPPVEETRYSWVRWNQPLDLLKIASHLRSHVGCGVELLDCMKPDENGKVSEDWLPRDRRYYSVKEQRYPMRRFGTSYGDIAKQLTAMQREQVARRGRPRSGSVRFAATGTRAWPRCAASFGRRCQIPRSCCLVSMPV